jgi:hypothetical protein
MYSIEVEVDPSNVQYDAMDKVKVLRIDGQSRS